MEEERLERHSVQQKLQCLNAAGGCDVRCACYGAFAAAVIAAVIAAAIAALTAAGDIAEAGGEFGAEECGEVGGSSEREGEQSKV
ncbi:unnamed protein product [Closterium sp. NIES-54]